MFILTTTTLVAGATLGLAEKGTFFVPVNLDIGLEDTYELRLLDEAGNESTYTINLRVMSKMITDVKLEVEGQENLSRAWRNIHGHLSTTCKWHFDFWTF